MPFRYLEHGSEVGILATGATIDEAVAEAARGLFGVQVDRAMLEPERSVRVEGTGEDLGACLVDFLNALLAKQDIEDLVFVDVRDLSVAPGGEGHVMAAEAEGVAPGRAAPHRLTEVKAVTYQGLEVRPADGGWLVRLVADV